ncbi:uncharacterized protein EHS24_004120 [Apiotrichum porosum]|uniref:Small ribosomal subunit protein mS41 n=1 Tax=Apiotrichum porosum TaxID=105984 RepID=A0A427Y4E3_9TREE|nr:uncharacterized protein EHS24_004120 [Apiotrichum porosum]RSH85935.1 hypothetical protein EHS24_004120 [Apiotrichum porosum]
MFAALRASTSRAGVRAFSVSTRAAAKQPLKSSSETPQPVDLLTKIGRGAEKKLGEKAATWNDLTKLYKTGSSALEDAGLGPKERKWVSFARAMVESSAVLEGRLAPTFCGGEKQGSRCEAAARHVQNIAGGASRYLHQQERARATPLRKLCLSVVTSRDLACPTPDYCSERRADRHRYIMWAFSRYSTGDAPSSFIEPPRPAKKIRGWGPRVQNGKRVK